VRAAAALVIVTALAACETPPLSLRFTLTDGDSQQCIADTGNETTSCDDVTMACKGVLSVRIVPPNQPLFPYVYVCEPLVGAQNKLCAIAGVDLPQPNKPVPEQVLEVQMAVFSQDSLIAAGLRDADGNFECPLVDFAANGLPEPAVDCTDGLCPVRPAVGGRAFYYPGDEKTVIKLGCTEQSLLTAETCKGPSIIEAIATVNDFDTWVPIASTTADRVTVSIGEPKMNQDGTYSLTSTLPLARIGAAGVPTWGAEVDFMPQTTLCVEVFEDAPQTTRALVCREVGVKDRERIDITGALLSRTTLTDILTAMNKTIFPDTGLVVGVVLNQFNQPVTGANVMPSCAPPNCTVQYLSADRKTLSATGGTSSNGIWISTNTPYGTTFSWSGQVQPAYGGIVQGKVTIVVLQESAPIGGT
jgi:hypothetical protein